MLLSVGKVAQRIGEETGQPVSPKMVSDTLYFRRPKGIDKIQIVGGRRLIPESYVPIIIAAMRDAGKLPAESHAAVS